MTEAIAPWAVATATTAQRAEAREWTVKADADRGDRDWDRRHHYRDRWSDLDDDRGRRRVENLRRV